jgi:hypothetical protein
MADEKWKLGWGEWVRMGIGVIACALPWAAVVVWPGDLFAGEGAYVRVFFPGVALLYMSVLSLRAGWRVAAWRYLSIAMILNCVVYLGLAE